MISSAKDAASEDSTAEDPTAEDTAVTKDATAAAPLDSTPAPLDTELVHLTVLRRNGVYLARSCNR